MPYGSIKVDNIVFTNAGSDQTITVSGLVASTSGNLTVTGTISGNTVQAQTVSGVTVTGTTANFVSGVFTTQISGATVVGNVGNFTTFTGGTITLTSGVIASGTAANPSLSILGDANTGLYSPGADQLAISTSGAQRLVVDASGNVGLKVAAPSFVSGYTGLQADGGSNGSVIKLTNSTTGSTGTDGFDLILQQGGSEAYVWQRESAPLIFGTAATERLRITSAGLVGVGNSIPGSFDSSANQLVVGSGSGNQGLTLYAGNTSNSNIYFADGTAGSAPYIGFVQYRHSDNRLDFGTNDGTRMSIDSSGRVGINTTSPGFPLQIGATGSPGIAIDSANSGIHGTFGSGGGLLLRAQLVATAGGGQILLGGSTRGDSDINAIVFSNANSERARITSSGQLLVGTSSARSNFNNSSSGLETSPLQIEGTTANTAGAAFVHSGANNLPAVLQFAKQRSGTVGGNTIVQADDFTGFISFEGNDGSEFVRCAAIAAQIDGTPGANDMPGRLVFSTTRDSQASPTEACRIDSSQRLLIGTVSTLFDPNPVLHVQGARAGMFKSTSGAGNETLTTWNDAASGTIYQIAFRDGAAGALRGTISTNGSSTAYNTTSDYRLKENVTTVTDGITRLQQLKPSRFNFIADPVKTVDGFIAHEVQAVVPEAIHGTKDEVDADGNPVYQGIDQSKLVPLLTAALQEAVAKIESLEARLTAAGI